jgi:PAS domain S-box-containing protein
MQESLFDKIPDGFLTKWQEMADLIAAVMDVPAALIMKTENELMEVYTASNTENNPYTAGDKENWHGLYCETVIKSQNKLSIANALKDEHWDKNPDIKLGMIAYLGYPINFPDHKPFGTLCVLDNKERQFSAENEKLLLQFKKAIELDLTLILALGLKEDYSHVDIIQKLSAYNEEYQASNEELRQAGEALMDRTEKLKHSHDLMSYIIKHNRSAVAVHDRDLNYIFVSQRYLDVYRVKESDIIGKHHYDVFPDLPQKWREVHQKALAGEVSSADRDPFYREDGSIDWTRWESRPWYEADGSIGGIIIYTEVINEQIEAEKYILKINEQLEQKVAEKTKELKERIVELERFHDATIQREFRIKELRDEIDRLKGGKR